MSKHYNIAVLGSGPGGYIAALKAAQLGAKTAVIERHPFFGGTCLNWGCIPSKALLATSELAHKMEHAGEMGIELGGQFSINWGTMQGRKDKILKGLRQGIKGLFAARKVDAYHGFGRLAGNNRITITGENHEVEMITADKIILATGSLPFRIPGWPDDPEFVCTSDESLHWNALPKSVVIIGGGVIGCEFACMMQPLGVDVTIVEILPKLLAGMDGALADELAKTFKQRGINLHLGTKVEDVALKSGGVAVRLGNGETLQVDKAIVAVGRRPCTKDIGADKAGIEINDRGFISVNDAMETSAAGVYAIGDANGRCMLAHAASAHGVVAVKNALGEPNYFEQPVPGCVYTFPEVAAVGLTQEQAEAQGLPVSIGMFPLGHLGKAMAANDTQGFVKVIRHRETGEMVGCHMIGHNVTEIIAAPAALMAHKVSVHDVAETVFAHPTISEAVKEASEDALSMALHLPPRKLGRVVVGT